MNAKSFDFLERVARIFERTDARYGLSCGRQDNNSFGDAFVDVQVGRLDVRIRASVVNYWLKSILTVRRIPP